MYQPEARHESLISKWKEVWQLALTAIKSVSLCRAACLTVSTMLHLNTVDYRAVADSIHEMMESIDMSGPAALTETSLDLWDILIEHWSVEARPTMPRYKTTIMQWLSSRFTPGNCLFIAVSPPVIKLTFAQYPGSEKSLLIAYSSTLDRGRWSTSYAF